MNGWGRMSLPLRDLMRCPNPTTFLDLRLLVVLMAFIPLCSSSTNHPISNLTLYPYYDQFYNQRPRGIPQQNFIAGSIQLDASKDIDPILMGKLRYSFSDQTTVPGSQTVWTVYLHEDDPIGNAQSLRILVTVGSSICMLYLGEYKISNEDLGGCIYASSPKLSDNSFWFVDLNVVVSPDSLHQNKDWYLERIFIVPAFEASFYLANFVDYGTFFSSHSPAMAFDAEAIDVLSIVSLGLQPSFISFKECTRTTAISFSVDSRKESKYLPWLNASHSVKDATLSNASSKDNGHVNIETIRLEYLSDTVTELRIDASNVVIYLYPYDRHGNHSLVLFTDPEVVYFAFANICQTFVRQWDEFRSGCSGDAMSSPYSSFLTDSSRLFSFKMVFQSVGDLELCNTQLPKGFFSYKAPGQSSFPLFSHPGGNPMFSVRAEFDQQFMQPWRCGFPFATDNRNPDAQLIISFSKMIISDMFLEDFKLPYNRDGRNERVALTESLWNISTSVRPFDESQKGLSNLDISFASVNATPGARNDVDVSLETSVIDLNIISSLKMNRLRVSCPPFSQATPMRVLLPDISYASDISLDSCLFTLQGKGEAIPQSDSGELSEGHVDLNLLKSLVLKDTGLIPFTRALFPCGVDSGKDIDEHDSSTCCDSFAGRFPLETIAIVDQPETFPSKVNKFALCPFRNVSNITLSNNGIEEVEEDAFMWSVRTPILFIDLTRNRLKSIPRLHPPGYASSTFDVVISLAHNYFDDVPLVLCPMWKSNSEIDFSFNRLVSFDLKRELRRCNSSSPFLGNIDLSNNDIRTVTYEFSSPYHEVLRSEPRGLMLYNFSNNRISSFSFRFNSSGLSLNGKGRAMGPAIASIDMSNNSLATLRSRSIVNAIQLGKLNLSQNLITDIELSFMEGSCLLYGCVVDVSGNRLGVDSNKELRVDKFFTNSSLRILDLSDNLMRKYPAAIANIPFITPKASFYLFGPSIWNANYYSFLECQIIAGTFYMSVLLGNNSFEKLTSSMCPLARLSKMYIDLSNSSVEYIGPDIFDCQNDDNRLMINLNRNPKLQCLPISPHAGLNTVLMLSLLDTNVTRPPARMTSLAYGNLNSLAVGPSVEPFIPCCHILPLLDSSIDVRLNPVDSTEYLISNIYDLSLGLFSSGSFSFTPCHYFKKSTTAYVGKENEPVIVTLSEFKSLLDAHNATCTEPEDQALYTSPCAPGNNESLQAAPLDVQVFVLSIVLLLSVYVVLAGLVCFGFSPRISREHLQPSSATITLSLLKEVFHHGGITDDVGRITSPTASGHYLFFPDRYSPLSENSYAEMIYSDGAYCLYH